MWMHSLGRIVAQCITCAGNAVQWYLQRLDKSMDEADGAPPAAAKTYYNVVQSPAGSSAAKGVASAMGTAIKLSAGAVKVGFGCLNTPALLLPSSALLIVNLCRQLLLWVSGLSCRASAQPGN